jgi:hypothetical protein
MKNKGFITMIGTILSFTFVISVNAQTIVHDPTPTQFEGIWRHPNPESENARITFSGNSFVYQWDNATVTGHFTINRRNINFISTDGSGNWTTTFTLNGNYLWLDRGRGGFWWYGSFINTDNNKKLYEGMVTDSTPTNLEGVWRHPNRQSENARFIFTGSTFSYQTDSQNISGRFSVDGKNIQFLTEDGWINWSTKFSLSGRNLTFFEGTGGFGWYGTFNKRDN